jgi:PIN domain nuclease of toxin-antitoxin system
LRLLLDTHVFLWWAGNSPELDTDARRSIAAEESFVAVSAAVAWEIAIKRALKKLRAPEDIVEQMERHQFAPLPITIEHAVQAGALPVHHRDPFDRMLVAQAQLEGLTIVTRDPNISLYSVATLAA